MDITKYRWSKAYESAEEELLELFARKNLQAIRWASDHDAEDETRQFDQPTRLWCAEGQLTCTVQNKKYSLQPGDTLSLPAGTSCVIRTGFGGFACYITST